jgi:uncharacterized protein (TIRG00374 family)
MNQKRALIYGFVLSVLALLVYMQFRTWRNFDWATFLSQTGRVNKLSIALAIGWIYLAYVMRAVRWSVFLRPVRRSSTARLFSPTVIGFTALALLGRAGEMIRPYLIARKENLPFPSQMAVWAVERIFDLGAFALMLLAALLLSPITRQLLANYRVGGRSTFAAILLGACLGILAIWKGDRFIANATSRLSPGLSKLGTLIAFRIQEFRSGLNTVQDFTSFAQASLASLGMWIMISFSYLEVLHAYGTGPLHMPITQVPLLMLSSMVGSMVALPGVGGGTQLATIFTLERIFGASRELAASCGILLWLITFASIVPLGLILAHRERLSIRELSAETQHAEEADVPVTSPRS